MTRVTFKLLFCPNRRRHRSLAWGRRPRKTLATRCSYQPRTSPLATSQLLPQLSPRLPQNLPPSRRPHTLLTWCAASRASRHKRGECWRQLDACSVHIECCMMMMFMFCSYKSSGKMRRERTTFHSRKQGKDNTEAEVSYHPNRQGYCLSIVQLSTFVFQLVEAPQLSTAVTLQLSGNNMPSFDFSAAKKSNQNSRDDVTTKQAPAAKPLTQSRREFLTSSPINGASTAKPDFQAGPPLPAFTFSTPDKAASASSKVSTKVDMVTELKLRLLISVAWY